MDDDEEQPIELNEIYRREVEGHTKKATITCKGVTFELAHVKLFAGEFSQHTIHLCANGRDVQHIGLSTSLPYIPTKFKAPNGKQFVYKGYVCSDFLDQRVNAERTAFDLVKDQAVQSSMEISEREIIDAVTRSATIELGPLLSEVEDRIKSRVELVITTKYPEYRPILKEVDTYLREFRENSEEREIVAKLNEIQFKEDLDARDQVRRILSESNGETKNTEQYQRLKSDYLKKANEIAQSRLAQCVIHRRIILDLLESQISCDRSGKFPKEERIHQLIFPMRKTSDDIDWDRQNLWIIDERLAYHRFLSSDKPIKSFSSNATAGDEPDLFILNTPGVFAAGEAPLTAAVIIEFKKAERGHFDENPNQQIYRYLKKLRGQEIKDSRGRAILMHTGAAFYCYIIADLTEELRTYAEDGGLDPCADGLGYYGFNRNYGAYLEIVSYDKLLKASRDRNRELFKALGVE
jgi:hypothetical protein